MTEISAVINKDFFLKDSLIKETGMGKAYTAQCSLLFFILERSYNLVHGEIYLLILSCDM